MELRILAWLKQETFCTWFDALKVLLPSGYGMKAQTAWVLCRGAGKDETALSPEEEQILRYLRGRRSPAPQEDLLDTLGLRKNHPARDPGKVADLFHRGTAHPLEKLQNLLLLGGEKGVLPVLRQAHHLSSWSRRSP